MDRRQDDGARAEDMAAAFLRLQGIRVLARDVSCAGVQVDMLARQQRRLLVIEVKLRQPQATVVATQALRPQQRLRLRRAAAWALERCAWAQSVRIDLVAVSWRPGLRHVDVDHVTGVE